MKPVGIAAILLILVLAISCDKAEPIADPSCDGEIMQLLDLTGLDGCQWVLRKDSTRFEPVNIESFDIPLRHEQLYYVEYDTIYSFSICMIGPTIEIECMQPLLLEPHE